MTEDEILQKFEKSGGQARQRMILNADEVFSDVGQSMDLKLSCQFEPYLAVWNLARKFLFCYLPGF